MLERFRWNLSKKNYERVERYDTPCDEDKVPAETPEIEYNYYKPLFYLSIVFCAALTSVLLLQLRSPDTVNRPVTLETLFGKVPFEAVIFNPNARMAEAVFPVDRANIGFIEVSNPAKWGLKGGFPKPTAKAPKNEIYSVSMLHQLHCLMILSDALNKNASMKEDEIHGLDTEPDHTFHCFDYLRQAIMCAGDLTLEGSVVVDGKVTNETDGWGERHLCRDWDTVYRYIENYAL